jgi:hypothetical protein
MANRAYLFVSDREDTDPRLSQQYPEDWYYDSRWCIPLTWFFFFEPGDVRLIPVQGWHEVCFLSEKRLAIERFDRRLALLRTLVDASVEWSRVIAFRDDLNGIEGRNLILNPNEILVGLSGDDEWHAERFRTILRSLDNPPPLDPIARNLLDDYVGERFLDAEGTLGQMVGFTYVRESRTYGLESG